MQISRNEFESLLREFWEIPERATEPQMETAALIAMAVESHPEFKPLLQRSIQNSTTAPAFCMKTLFLKRGLSSDTEFDRWVQGLKNVAEGTEPAPKRKWWQFWKAAPKPRVEQPRLPPPARDDLVRCPICSAKVKPANYERHASKCRMRYQSHGEKDDVREQGPKTPRISSELHAAIESKNSNVVKRVSGAPP